MQKFNYKKRYGQNFLVDLLVIDKISNTITPSENDLIIEIGSGTGNLTKNLKKYNCKILSYEIDLDTKNYLDKIKDDKTSFIFGDFLKRNIKEDIKKIPYDKIFIIGNIPYYITTPIINKITEENLNVEKIILMMQKEVGERLSAQPGSKDYGYITVYLNYHYNIKKLFYINKNSFKPAPNVESIMVEFTPKEKLKLRNEKEFIILIKCSFSQKRKTLLNNLKHYDAGKIKEVLDKYNINYDIRAEAIPLEVFVDISNNLF